MFYLIATLVAALTIGGGAYVANDSEVRDSVQEKFNSVVEFGARADVNADATAKTEGSIDENEDEGWNWRIFGNTSSDANTSADLTSTVDSTDETAEDAETTEDETEDSSETTTDAEVRGETRIDAGVNGSVDLDI